MTQATRRKVLTQEGKRKSTNAGLWLDKYIKDQDREGTARRELVEEVANIRQPEWYPFVV